MDAKGLAWLRELYAQIVAGNFTERDVRELLLLVHEDVPGEKVLRELRDFVGHRSRSRGPVHDYMLAVKDFAEHFNEPGRQITINPVFTEVEIAATLNAVFEKHGRAALTPARSRQVQLAILSMLQHIEMTYKGKQFGVLELWIYRDTFRLMPMVTLEKLRPGTRIAFPALMVTNDAFPMHAPEHVFINTAGRLTVVVRNGITELQGIKPFEYHIERKRVRGQPPPAPITWAEVQAALPGFPVVAVNPEAQEFVLRAQNPLPLVLRLGNGRISFSGHPDHFRADGPMWPCICELKRRLGAYLFNEDAGYLADTEERVKALEPEPAKAA